MRALVLLAALSSAAMADPRDDGVETLVFALPHGMSVGYEHHIARAWSLVGIVGLRGGALGDYTSTTWDGGIEARWWLRARLDGFYVGLHTDIGRTALAMTSMPGPVTTSWGFEQRVDVGWRFTIRNRVSITPSIGLGAHEDVDRLLGASLHPVAAFGLAVGFLF